VFLDHYRCNISTDMPALPPARVGLRSDALTTASTLSPLAATFTPAAAQTLGAAVPVPQEAKDFSLPAQQQQH